MNRKSIKLLDKDQIAHQWTMKGVFFLLFTVICLIPAFSDAAITDLVDTEYLDDKLTTKTSRILGTDVSGNLIDNDIWTVANSPYNIVGDVGVPGGLTLTIDPGVVINYTGDFRILVFGAIQVNGTEADSVRFNGNGVVGTKYMLEIRRTNLDNSNIDYAVFEGPQGAILQGKNTDLPLNVGLLSILGTSITNSILFTNPDLADPEKPNNVSGLKFIKSRINDVKIIGAINQSDLYLNEGYPFQFQNGSISNTLLQGINCFIDSSNIYALNRSGFLIPHFRANNSIFLNSLLASIGPGNDFIPAFINLTIGASKIIGTPISSQNILLKNSILISGEEGTILISLRENMDGLTSFIDSVSFVGKVNTTAIHLSASDQNLDISSSGFYGFNIGILNSGLNELSVVASNFHGSNQYNIKNDWPANITATGNYWDSDSPTIIASKIYDQIDNLELGLVDITGFLTNPSVDAPISPPLTVVKMNDGAGGLTITWAANPESDVAGYKVYWGDFTGYSFVSNTDVGNVLTYSIPGLSISDNIAVTTYDNLADGTNDQIEGHESWFSFAEMPPEAPVLNIAELVGLNVFTASWSEVQNATSYLLSVSANPDFSTLVDGYENLEVFGLDMKITGLEPGMKYWFKVVSKNTAGVSTPSGVQQVLTRMFSGSSLISVSTAFQSPTLGMDFLDIQNDGDLEMIISGGTTTTGPYTGFFDWKNDEFSELVENNIQDFWASSSVSGDINMDGRIDIIIYGDDGNFDRIGQIYSMEDDGFSKYFEYQPNGNLIKGDGSLLDYDNDGDIDLYHSSLNKIFINNKLVFGDLYSLDFLVGLGFDRIADYDFGDYDADGDLDIVVSYYSNGSSRIKIWENINTGFEEVDVAINYGYTSDIDFVDWDSDGDLDIAICGGTKIAIYDNEEGQFIDRISGDFYEYTDGFIYLMDFFDANQDGLLDLMIFGELYDPQFQFRNSMYTNSGIGFDLAYNSPYEDFSQVSTKFSDVDGDKDLDYIVSGRKDDVGTTDLYINEIIAKNSQPDAPSNLQALIEPNKVIFSWDKANDVETPQNGLNYNLYIGTASGTQDIRPSNADLTTGFRRIVRRGDIQSNSWFINDLAPGTYFWSVQAIDASYAGGAFAEEQSFTITGNEVSVPTITSFSFPQQISTAVINASTHTINISVRDTTNVTALKASFTLSAGATAKVGSIVQTSGVTTNDFTNPVTYTVTAQDGVTTQNWVVTVTKQSITNNPPTITSFSPKSGPIGTSVSITGTNFNTTPVNNIVYFGATKAVVTAATTTELIVMVPAGATYEPISVLNRDNRLATTSHLPFSTSFEGNLNQGNEIFTSVGSFEVGTYPIETKVGDLDCDGKSDLIVVNSSDNTVNAYRNQSEVGNIQFELAGSYQTEQFPTSLAISDLDGDGLLDIVVCNESGDSFSVFRNANLFPSEINFDNKIDFSVASPCAIAVADFENDGRMDLAIANCNTNRVSIFRNVSTHVGEINFEYLWDLVVEAEPVSIATGDFDIDGLVDMMVVSRGGDALTIFRNETNNSSQLIFNQSFKHNFNGSTWPSKGLISDLDGDEMLDLAIIELAPAKVSFFRNSGMPSTVVEFNDPLNFEGGVYMISASIADLTGDGKPDLVYSDTGLNEVVMLKNESEVSSINFNEKTKIMIGSSPASISLFDMDGDGASDILVSNTEKKEVSVFRNVLMNEGFSNETSISSFSFPQQISTAVINASTHTINISVRDTTNVTTLKASYTLSAGATAKVGSIVQTSGVTTNDFTNPVTYTVTAQDGVNTQDWAVTVTKQSITNNPPTISPQSFSINENSINGTVVGTVHAFDPNGDALSFNIISGTAFAIGSTSGILTVADKTQLDYESNTSLVITVKVSDGILDNSANITVNLNDVNEVINQAPQIIGQTFIIEENIINNDLIGFANASDPDDDIIAYSISSGNGDGTFLINSTTGEIILTDRNKLDFTNIDLINLIVSVTDGSLSASSTIIIDLNNPTFFSTLVYPIENNPMSNKGLNLNGYVQDMDGISEVWLHYKRPTHAIFDSTELVADNNGFFEFNDILPFDSLGLLFKYKALDQLGFSTFTDEILIPSVVEEDAWNMEIAGGSGKSVKNYSIISFPFSSPDVEVLFSELGPYNNNDWRLFRLSDNGAYQEFGEFQDVIAGKGYWFIVKKDHELKVGGRSVEFENGNFVMNLKEGYNIIGNPFLAPLNWNDVVEYNLNHGYITLSDIDIANRTSIYGWNTAYVSKSILNEFEGGIIKMNRAVSGFLIPPTAVSTSGNRNAFELPVSHEVSIDGDSWEVNLYFKTGSYDYYLSGIGIDPNASDEADIFDRELLPPFVLYLDVKFDDGFTKSVKETADFKTWSFTTPNNLDEKYFNLSWDTPFSTDKTIILVDGASRTLSDFKEVNYLKFPNRANVVHYLYFGSKKEIYANLDLPFDLVFETYPNPVKEILNIGLYASEDKYAKIEMISIDGRSVFNMNIQLFKGINQNTINLEELNIPDGIYFFKLEERIMTKFIKQ